MIRAMRAVPLVLLASVLIGCAQERTYQVSLVNHTDQPITFGMVKEGEPLERKWMSPGTLMAYGDEPDPTMWGAISPGRTAVSKPVSGKFDSGARAYLEVFLGKLDLYGVMAVSRGQPDRLDLLLRPGLNRFVITDDGGHFTGSRVPAPDSPAAAH